jgi:hypothetical protein
LGLLAACGADRYSRHADRRRPLEAASNCYHSADDALSRGRADECESYLREAIEIDPSFVRARRRLQDLQIATFRREEALAEAEIELARHPDSPQANYLMSRVRDGVARLASLQRALELDPWYGWARMGLANYREDFVGPGEGLAYARESAALLPGEPDPLLSVIRSARNAGDPYGWEALLLDGFTRFYDEEPAFGELAIRHLILEANTSSVAGLTSRALIEERGEDLLRFPSVTFALAEAVRRALPQTSRDRIDDALARVEKRGPYSVELEIAHARLRAELAWSAGRALEALGALERARTLGDRSPTLIRALRLARIQNQDYRGSVEFERELLAEFAAGFDAPVAPEESLLLIASERAAAFPRDGAAVFSFAKAAAAAGWIDEASELGAQASNLGFSGSEIAEFRVSTAGFRRFLARMRSELRRKGRPSLSLTGALEPLRVLGRDSLGFDPVEGSRVHDYFPMGYLMDGDPSAPGLPQLLNRYGYEIRLGKRLWGPVEAFALRRVAARPVKGTILGRPYEGREVLGEGSSLFTQLETVGARFAGSTLPGSVFLVLDPIDEAAREIEEQRDSLTSPAPRWKHQRLPIAKNRAERIAADETFDLSRRLVARAAARDPRPLAPRVLAGVRDHEYGHLADAQQFLPLLLNVHHVVAWLFSSGFSPDAIEARLEMRAELASMCVSADPELSLAEVARSAERPESAPPHSRGFAELTRSFVLEVDRRMERGEFPAIERDHAILPQLWKLSPDEIRSVARSLAEAEGLVATP